MGRIFGYKSGQTGGSSPFHGRLLATIKIDFYDRQGIYQGNYLPYHGSQDREECGSCDRFNAGDYDWLHCKRKMPLYENNFEQSNEDCKAFKAITDKMSDTYKRKNHDYGNAFSEMYDELGINYGYGKIREKVNRIKTLKDNEAQVANEPLEDALLDCANYCILTLMEYQKRKEHGTD